jgi:WD40 repeat protein
MQLNADVYEPDRLDRLHYGLRTRRITSVAVSSEGEIAAYHIHWDQYSGFGVLGLGPNYSDAMATHGAQIFPPRNLLGEMIPPTMFKMRFHSQSKALVTNHQCAIVVWDPGTMQQRFATNEDYSSFAVCKVTGDVWLQKQNGQLQVLEFGVTDDSVKDIGASFGNSDIAVCGNFLAVTTQSKLTLLSSDLSEIGSSAINGVRAVVDITTDGKSLCAPYRFGALLFRTFDLSHPIELRTTKRINDLAFSPCDRLLALADDSGDVSLWSTQSGSQVASFSTERSSFLSGTAGALSLAWASSEVLLAAGAYGFLYRIEISHT